MKDSHHLQSTAETEAVSNHWKTKTVPSWHFLISQPVRSLPRGGGDAGLCKLTRGSSHGRGYAAGQVISHASWHSGTLVVLGADLVYYAAGVRALMETLAQLLRTAPHALAVFAFIPR
jgi:hypothetical protein